MDDETRETVALDYARPPRPKPRDWGAWGVVAFAAVLAVAFLVFVLLVALIDY